MIKMRMTVVLAVVVCFSASLTHADSVAILSVTPIPGMSGALPVGGINSGPAESQFVGISFGLDHTFNDVAITIPNMGFSHDWGGTAWLTDAIGPDATLSNVIASEYFGPVPPSGSSAVFEDYTFLSDLNLSVGTYFFFLSSPVCIGSGCGEAYGLWPSAGGAPSAVHTAPGTSFLGSEIVGGFMLPCSNPANCPAADSAFPPASPWSFEGGERGLGPAITITAARDVPEPETVVLVFTELLLVGLARPQYRRRKSHPQS